MNSQDSGPTTEIMAKQPPERLIKLSEVMARTSLSRAHIYALIKKGAFPIQRKLGNKCSRWLESEIDAWTRSL